VLLGEKHDNPDHHRLQAEVLRGLIAAGRRPAVGFEMFSLDDAGAIADHLARAPSDAAGLGPAVNWQKSGWPDWAMYQPIAEAALAAKLAIVATNLPLATARQMSRDGLALEPSVRRDLGLDRPLADVMLVAMAADIRSSHCGHGSAQSVQQMVQVQRARDAQMAHSLAAAASADGAVLVAGAGHVRSDYGIPVYLTAKAPGRPVAIVGYAPPIELPPNNDWRGGTITPASTTATAARVSTDFITVDAWGAAAGPGSPIIDAEGLGAGLVATAPPSAGRRRSRSSSSATTRPPRSTSATS